MEECWQRGPLNRHTTIVAAPPRHSWSSRHAADLCRSTLLLGSIGRLTHARRKLAGDNLTNTASSLSVGGAFACSCGGHHLDLSL